MGGEDLGPLFVLAYKGGRESLGLYDALHAPAYLFLFLFSSLLATYAIRESARAWFYPRYFFFPGPCYKKKDGDNSVRRTKGYWRLLLCTTGAVVYVPFRATRRINFGGFSEAICLCLNNATHTAVFHRPGRPPLSDRLPGHASEANELLLSHR